MTKEAKTLITIGIVTLIVLIGGVFLLNRGAPSPSNTGANVPANSPLLVRSNSDKTASDSAQPKVTVVEFADYECSACGEANPIIQQILKNYDGKINFVFRNFPLPQHQNSMIAAEVAEAAGEQGKFWEMHDKLYETQNDWSNSNNPLELFISYAKDMGLDTAKIRNEVSANKFSAKIQQDIADATALGINETPTFFINGQELLGVQVYGDLKKIIDADLAK